MDWIYLRVALPPINEIFILSLIGGTKSYIAKFIEIQDGKAVFIDIENNDKISYLKNGGSWCHIPENI